MSLITTIADAVVTELNAAPAGTLSILRHTRRSRGNRSAL